MSSVRSDCRFFPLTNVVGSCRHLDAILYKEKMEKFEATYLHLLTFIYIRNKLINH